jgi:hypothetical protein
MSRSSTKTMLIVFFDICSIVHREFIPQGQTDSTKFYCDVWGRTFSKSDRICGMRRIGFSTTTMHPVTEHSSVSFSPTTTRRFRIRPIARFSSYQLLPFPEDEDAAERPPFSHRCRDPAQIADYHACDHRNTSITTPDVN